MEKRLVEISRFLSLVLRHKPGVAGVELDSGGWVEVDHLLNGLEQAERPLSRADLYEVIKQNDKQRFVIRNGRIRASQGHSIPVDLGLEPSTPPEVLYHGTSSRTIDRILSEGLRPMARQHVHLSKDRETAAEDRKASRTTSHSGSRHGCDDPRRTCLFPV